MLLRRAGREIQPDRRPRARAPRPDRPRRGSLRGNGFLTRGPRPVGDRARIRAPARDRRPSQDRVGDAHVRRAVCLVPEPDGMSKPGAKRAEEDRRPLRSFLRYFLGLGTWGFGGPIASVGYMQRDLVEKRGWLTERDFLNGVALGQTMPGPLAAQVVMWVGFLQEGALGALVTAAFFIFPSLLLVLAVAAVYVPNQGLAIVQDLFY